MGTTRLGRDFSSPHVYRDDNLRTSAVTVDSRPGDLYGWNIINPNSSAVYIKLYDTTDTVTIGTTTVIKTLQVPAMSTVLLGSSTARGQSQMVYNTGLKMAVTTEMADNGTTAPTLAVYTEIYYLS